MRKGLILAVTVALIGSGTTPSPALAQEALHTTLLGTWEGKVIFGESAPAVLEFSVASGGSVRWTYRFKFDPVLWGDAEGTVTSFSPPTLELAGAWTKHAVAGAAGTRVKFHLAVDGDLMKGIVIAEMNNTPVQISLTLKR